MSTRDFSCIPAARAQIEQAVEKLQTACTILRKAGLTESADQLVCKVKWLRTWTEPDGYLDWMEKPQPEEQDAG